ncbi:MAG: TonB-dependent receptor [Acidobacteria bacterium]|nr:TonB-dependent receptor [Acidobacteriota bacterium]
MRVRLASARLARAAVMLIALVSLLSLPALAATGSIKVTVLEATSAGTATDPLPGATVQLSEPSGQFQALTIVADANGVALFPVVPVGSTYVVTVQMPGYAPTRVNGVAARSGIETPVPVALIAELQEQVEVVGRGNVVELERGATSTTEISDELFQDLPVFGREYQNVLDVAAGVQDSDGDGNPNVHGSREQDFQMTVDGVSNVDPLSGERLSSINPDAIDEIQIIDSGADATFGGAIGGFGRIKYKTGGNEFEGSTTFYFRDSVFDNDAAGGRAPLDYYVYRPAVYLSGPIVRDKVWFTVSHEMIKAQFPIDILGGPDIVQRVDQFTNLDIVTWQATTKDQLQFRFGSDPLEISPQGVDSVTPAESGYNASQSGPSASMTWKNQFSGTLFFESLVAFQDIQLKINPFAPDARNTCVPDAPDFANKTTLFCRDLEFGNQASGGFGQDVQSFRRRWTYQSYAEKFIGDWLGGTHRITAGFNLERAAYEQDQTIEPSLRRSAVPLSGDLQNPTAAVPSARIRETIPFPSGLSTESRGNYYALFFNDVFEVRPNLSLNIGVRYSREELSSDGYVPIDFDAERARFDSVVEQCIQTRCIQSNGQLNGPCVNTCAAGASYVFTAYELDNPSLYPACTVAPNSSVCDRLQVARDFAAANNDSLTFREQERFTITNDNFEPRLSISWDPWNDTKTKIVAAWNRFYGNTFLQPLVNELGPDVTTDEYTVTNQDSRRDDVPVLTAFQLAEVDRDLKRQYSDEWTIRFEREIADETSFVFRYVNRKYRNQFQDRDVNRRPVIYDDLVNNFPLQFLGFERCDQIGEFADCTGDLIFRTEGGLGGGGYVAVPDGVADLQLISPLYNQVYRVSNFDESEYQAYILELTRRFYQNWEMSASYTWSESFGTAESFTSASGDDATNADDEAGPLSDDQRHVVTVFGRVFIPRWGGFRIGGVLNYETGLPYSIVEPRTIIDFPTNLAGVDYLNPATVQYSSQRFTYPTDQRNDQRNEPRWNLDLNVQKEFSIKDVRATVQFNIFNVLNDSSLYVGQVVQSSGFNNQGELITTRTPVAVRNFGRQFELLLKANF